MLPSAGVIFRSNCSDFLKSLCEVGEFLDGKALRDTGNPLIFILSQIREQFPPFFRHTKVLRSPVDGRLIDRQTLIHQRISESLNALFVVEVTVFSSGFT